MEQTDSAALSLTLMPKELEQLRKRYHFAETEKNKLTALYERTAAMLEAKAYWRPLSPDMPGGDEDTAMLCAVTLGKSLDALQMDYMRAEGLSESYKLECIGSALLEKAYLRLGELIRQKTGLCISKMTFPGSELPLESLHELRNYLACGSEHFPITCSESCMLYPKKSVIFIGYLSEKESEGILCRSCSNTACQMRQKEMGDEE